MRVGGRFRIVFGGAEGKEHECAGVYKEVEPNRKLVFTWCWPNTTPERISLVTIVLKKMNGETELELRHEQFVDEKSRDSHKQGWSALLENLAASLQSST